MNAKKAKIIFVTGTDTNVGKTLLTALLVYHLRQKGIHALAIKPFCSGGFDDVDLLRAAQKNELTREEISPFYFSQPLAPLVAAKRKNELPTLKKVLEKVSEIQSKCEVLLIEGSGGLMVPLGEDFFVVDMIRKLNCDVILAARNRLGTINHTLLSIEALKKAGKNRKMKVVISDQNAKLDLSASSNSTTLMNYLPQAAVFSLPFLGKKANKISNLEKNCKKIKKTLAGLV